VTHIFNGFDPEDFSSGVATVPPPARETCRLVYTGTLYHLMSPEPLVRAIEALAAQRPDLARRIELVFAGRHTRNNATDSCASRAFAGCRSTSMSRTRKQSRSCVRPTRSACS
jgi:hypothetical protein